MKRLSYLEFYNQRRTLTGEAVVVEDTDGQEYVVQMINDDWVWMDTTEYLEHRRMEQELASDWDDYWTEDDELKSA